MLASSIYAHLCTGIMQSWTLSVIATTSQLNLRQICSKTGKNSGKQWEKINVLPKSPSWVSNLQNRIQNLCSVRSMVTHTSTQRKQLDSLFKISKDVRGHTTTADFKDRHFQIWVSETILQNKIDGIFWLVRWNNWLLILYRIRKSFWRLKSSTTPGWSVVQKFGRV